MFDRKQPSSVLRIILKQYYLHIGAIVFFMAAGLAAAMLESRTSYGSPLRDGEWTIPADRPAVLSSSLNTMLANPLFGGEPVLMEPPPSAVENISADEGTAWSLVGIVFEGVNRSIVFRDMETGRLHQAQLGDTLPGGEILKTIYANSIEIAEDQNDTLISLFSDSVGEDN